MVFLLFCSSLTQSLSCLNDSQCAGLELTSNSTIICDGHESCVNAISINGTTIKCDGYLGCRFSGPIIANEGSILCRSYFSCSSVSSIKSLSSTVVCSAPYSCAFLQTSNLYGYDYVVCEGRYACASYAPGIGIEAQTRYINCDGPHSCFNVSSISSGLYIRCTAREACTNVTSCGISAGSYIFCHARSSCAHSKIIYAGTQLWCYGQDSCKCTNISGVPFVRGYGYESLSNGFISNKNLNNSDLQVLLYGYDAGNGLVIECVGFENGLSINNTNLNVSDEYSCLVFCKGNACSNTVLIGNGTFVVDCDESQGIDCPVGYSYDTTTTSTFPATSSSGVDINQSNTRTPVTSSESTTLVLLLTTTHTTTDNSSDGINVNTCKDKKLADFGEFWFLLILSIMLTLLLIGVCIIALSLHQTLHSKTIAFNIELESTRQSFENRKNDHDKNSKNVTKGNISNDMLANVNLKSKMLTPGKNEAKTEGKETEDIVNRKASIVHVVDNEQESINNDISSDDGSDLFIQNDDGQVSQVTAKQHQETVMNNYGEVGATRKETQIMQQAFNEGE